ncbi:hypothetical protein ACJIZ3_014029 [Penstemon smallii]|uniref:NB-ARC domain-containing protein n=1 Tax=Penstemon smallii TaxID=265156 RepID=A0ABD3RLV9_9LAMI
MGGIGKTTLARCIYNDPLIQEYFHIHAWTTVPYQYSLRKMLIHLLGSIGHFSVELGQESIDKLEVKLYQSLKGRRYLIVMDDFWFTEAWDDVRRFFPDDNNGSRIILTTRNSGVAKYAQSEYIHWMNCLSLDGSWNLLSQKVFEGTQCPSPLESLGMRIASRCEGIPLAIVVLGGLLSNVEKTWELWQHFTENISLAIAGDNYIINKILALSYSQLPQHLKACFLYMGAFPEGREIHVSDLIKLWVAEGFIKPVGNKSLEEVAMENLKDLIDRSLVLVERLSSDGEIKTCSIHDLLLDISIRKAWEEDFLAIIPRDVNFSCWEILGKANLRRISFQFCPLKYSNKFTNSSMRSLLHFGVGYSSDGILPFTMNLRLLRVLEALSVTFDEFPVEIVKKLVNLKYLAFTCHERNIPPSISKLCNLQTLIVYGDLSPEHIFNLPSEIWQLPQLRHIIFQRCILQFPSRADHVPLKNLQTLANVYNFKFTERVFRFMPNLKKLVISYIYDSHTIWSPYHFNHFVHLLHLETLKCYFIAKSIYAPGQLLNFVYPERLKKLTLSGCTLPWDFLTFVGLLPNLEVLKLKDDAFVGSVWETNEEEFLRLKYLLIASSSLEHWKTEETHFPRLRHLSLKSCSELKEIPSEIGNIPTLEIIELFECSASVVDSAHQIKEEQQSYGNDDFRVLCS